MIRVSVLTPVYNVQRYLRQCLDSLAAQTLEDIEFICIDDGSTDESGCILDEYAVRDARFQVIHKANSGYGASMNAGLRCARGRYIGIVESDDYADADMFQKLYEAAETHQAEVVRSNYWATTQQGSSFREELKGHPYGRVFCPMKEDPELLLKDPNIWTALYRRDFLLQHDIWFNETPGASYQDLSFSFLTLSTAERVFLLRDAYLHYRMDNAGSSVHSSGKVCCVMDEYDAMETYLLHHQGTKEQHIWAAKMFHRHCQENERRIDGRYLPLYWKEAILRYQKAAEQGYLLHESVKKPEEWIVERVQMRQKDVLLREGFFWELEKAQRVFLYGAGKVTVWLLDILKKNGISPAGILVTTMEGKPSEIHGVPVYALSASPADRACDRIVLAISPRHPAVQQEILLTLDRAGYHRVLVLTGELQAALA